MTKQAKQTLSWFGAGFVLAAILTINLEATRFVPVAVAFGLLCFLCGVAIMQFLGLRRETGEWMQKTFEAMNKWEQKFNKMNEEEAKFNAEKAEWEAKSNAEKAEWEVYKQVVEEAKAEWEANKEVAVFDEIARMSKEEPDRLLTFHKQLLRMAEKEAARRGGEQIEREVNPHMEKRVRCNKCDKAFEVVGERGTMKEVPQSVTCPYDGCEEKNEVTWPMDKPFLVRKIPSEM
jgi:hypothetical protein